MRPGDDTPTLLRKLREQNATTLVVAESRMKWFPFLDDPSLVRVMTIEWPQVNNDVNRAFLYAFKDESS